MQLIDNINTWRALRAAIPAHQTLGFVPTMGNLHPGHLSLCAQSLAENTFTVVSLFINPTQFQHADDLTHYPRTIEADVQQLSDQGVHYCFMPTEPALYADHYRYRIEETVESLSREGQSRPGHYTGVLTVVMKLFQLMQPHHAYFGEKDYQQYELIRGMAEAFFMNITLRCCPTIREPSGLPYSSRNNRLSAKERYIAEEFARLFAQPSSLDNIRHELELAGIEVDYLETHQGRRYAAVKIGAIRLIDNRPDPFFQKQETLCAN
ncbi:MAG: pantoate--beta-alanine ligase [Gammaproteobacteria bacterium]|nr:pantoate--beta-alanine ligase [Gammaproteobacteria bacterium]